MRSFLDSWQAGGVKRLWGGSTLAFATALAVAGLSASNDLAGFDVVVLVTLVAVLAGDGLLNVLPAGFQTFKTRLQDAWVRRYRGTGREHDRDLFAFGNAILAVAALGVVAVVTLYRPIDWWVVAIAAIAAALLTALLVAAARPHRSGDSPSAPYRPPLGSDHPDT